MAKLIVVEGPDLGNEYELPRGDAAESSTIGRDVRAAITLADGAVSREHCRVEVKPRGFRLVDLKSRNRTFVNTEPVEEVWLRDGDVIRIGDTELKFSDDAPSVEPAGAETTIVRKLSLRGEGHTGEPRIDAPGGERDARQVLPRLHRVLGRLRSTATSSAPKEVLAGFLAELVDAIDLDHAAFLVEADGHWVVQAHAARPGASEPFRANLEVVARAAKEKLAILSASAQAAVTTPSAGPRSSRPGGADDADSLVALPLRAGERVVGVVCTARTAGRPALSGEELEVLELGVEPLGAFLATLREQGRLLDENRSLVRSLAGSCRIIGRSPAVLGVHEFIRRAAPTVMTVLILGETGTGKELVASSIHYLSPRRNRPFVAINCAALPEHLVESELFGHERGAFTGAIARKKGRFELASTGTVFLDEIGELTPACQAKLLRLLEERRCDRVGGVEPVDVDVRIIAATNKDLLEAVAAGRFREDLYYRLGVLSVSIPPLRDRREDVPLLVEHFLAAHLGGQGLRRLSAAAMDKLASYPWPGNVRQLRNVVESALVLSDGDEVRAEDVVLPERSSSKGGAVWEPISLQDLERGHIVKVLELTRGNKKRAAEILGIERCTLYAKLKSYAAVDDAADRATET